MGSKKVESLRRKSDFLAIRKSGKQIRLNHWLLLTFKKNGINKFRMGITIPKKVGNAVTRNKIKRWCRECFRKQLEPNMPGVDINVVLFKGPKDFYKNLEFRKFKEIFNQSWARVRKNI